MLEVRQTMLSARLRPAEERRLMRELSFTEVRAAGLPAVVKLTYVTYEYRPLYDDVAVRITMARQPHVATTYRIPQTGWRHQRDCTCSYCQAKEMAVG